MKRNCNLELRLLPSIDSGNQYHNWTEEMSEKGEKGTEQQQLTIFYNGRVCVCDVTEIQAREILLMANRDEKMEVEKENSISPASDTRSGAEAPALPSQMHTGLSMKRSLQRFLQKRKHRVQAAFPY